MSVSDLLLSMRRTVEIPILSRWREGSDASEASRRAVLAVESIRLPLRSAFRQPPEAFHESASRLLSELRDLKSNPDFLRSTSRVIRLAIRPDSSRVRIASFDPKLLEGRTLGDALDWLIDRVESELGLAKGKSSELGLRELRKIIPVQKVAPVQFEIRAGRLAIVHNSSTPDKDDEGSVRIAREELTSKGAKILQEIERSNCDRRLLETFAYMQDQLKNEENVIKLGLSNLHCEAMFTQFQNEIPDALSAMLRAHTRSIEMFAAQFPEWNRFVENASSSMLSSRDIEDVRDTAQEVLDQIRSKPELAEPEVPKTILHLSELLKHPGTSAKRATFAMLRTLENMISRIYGYATDFIDATITKTIETTSTRLSQAAAIGLLTLALSSATSLQPVSGKIAEMQWIKAATESLRKQIETLSSK